MHTSHSKEHHKQAYLWISIALAMPILLWPSFIYIGFNPAFGVSIEQNWTIAACTLLIAAVVADTILLYHKHPTHIIIRSIWIIIVSYSVSLSLRNPNMVWLIAALFAIHPLHISHQLWQGNITHQHWWQWVAWWRDSSIALMMFLWLNYWPQ